MAYLNQLQPANAMKPNLDVAARGAQKKKKKKRKVQPSTETLFRNSLGGFEDVQLAQFKAVPAARVAAASSLSISHIIIPHNV